MPIISHESVSRYGWHIPELGKIITVNLAFTRTVELMGCRENAKTIDLSEDQRMSLFGDGPLEPGKTYTVTLTAGDIADSGFQTFEVGSKC